MVTLNQSELHRILPSYSSLTVLCYTSQRNVLIDDDGTPLLCDFGRSRFIGQRGFTTEFAGTVRYLAPELIDCASNNATPLVTEETDIYAFSMAALEVNISPLCNARRYFRSRHI
jgi:serine/threonine protein kinase